MNEEFDNCINNACIYCPNLEKYIPLKKYIIKFMIIYTRRHQVAEFIKKFSSKEIKPFPLTKLETYEYYIKIYKNRHFKISKFYGDLNPESYQKYIKEMIDLIDKKSKSKELIKNKNAIIDGLLFFDFEKDVKALDVLIIKEMTKNSFLMI